MLLRQVDVEGVICVLTTGVVVCFDNRCCEQVSKRLLSMVARTRRSVTWLSKRLRKAGRTSLWPQTLLPRCGRHPSTHPLHPPLDP